MRETKITLDVVVIEASDLDGVDDEGRISGSWQEAADALALKFPRGTSVTVGTRHHPKKDFVAFVKVEGQRLIPGDGVVIHPLFGVVRVPAADVPKPVAKKAAKKAVGGVNDG